jgi:plastocyanin
MTTHLLIASFTVALFAAHANALAAEVVVSQKGKAFSTSKVKLKVGDAIKFLNEDPFSHNVFSLSPVKSFDLGSYPQGGAKSVIFDKPGTVDVECAIHPDMTLTVEVEK